MSTDLHEVVVNGARYVSWHPGHTALAEEWDELCDQVERFDEALRRIADSYHWDPYEEDETVGPPWPLSEQPPPTNRRIAREALKGES